MKKELIEILLKHNIIVIENLIKVDDINKDKEIEAIKASFLSIGYLLEEDNVNLSLYSLSALRSFYKRNFNLLKEIKGGGDHVIFYKQFPLLGNISEEEYQIRAMLHYLTARRNSQGFMNDDLCEIKKNENEEINEEIEFETMKIMNEDKAISFLNKLFVSLFEGKTVINSAYKYAIELFTKEYKLGNVNDIPFKENIAFYVNLRAVDQKISYRDLNFVKNVNDILRVYRCICAPSDSTLTNNHFSSIPRKSRRTLIKKLETLSIDENVIDDFLRYKNMWKNAFNYLHVFEYKTIAPHVYEIANKLRNEKVVSYYGKLDSLIENQEKYLNLLSEKPGEYARKLFFALSLKHFDQNKTLNGFKKIAPFVSTKVLLELYNYSLNRNGFDFRLFKIITPDVLKYHQEEEKREQVDDDLLNKVKEIIISALKTKFSSYPKMENVYLDPTLKDIIIPPTTRNSSITFSNLLYGSKVKIENKRYLRCFTRWKNTISERVDIDLSMEVFNDKFEQVASLAWHNMWGGKVFDAYHSGDIVSAPRNKGASEFIDVDLIKAKRKGVSYLVICNSSFTGVPYNKMDYCYSGIMLTENKLTRLYKENLVSIKSRLNQQGSGLNVAFIIDLNKNELIWIDAPIANRYCCVSCDDLSVKSVLVDALKKRMNFYEFIKLHETHVNFVENKDEASVIIANDINATINPINLSSFSTNWY